MVRCRLRNIFSISPIFSDLCTTKPIKIPISLRKLISIFPYLARFDRTCSKVRHFRWLSNIVLRRMTRLNFNEFNLQMLSSLKLCTNARSSTLFVKLVKLNDEREALGFCLPPNLIYRKFLIRLGRMWRSFCWNDSGLFSLIKNYRHLSFSVVMLTFWVMMGCGTGRENFSAV